jgi:hypothetical protein
MDRWTKRGWGLALGYFALAIIVQALIERSLFDLRELDRNLVDYAWQLELIYAADLGHWSGRDVHYPRGPLFQLIGYLASRPGPIEPSHTFAVLHAIYKLLSLVLVFFVVFAQAGASRPPRFRLMAFVAAGILSYAVGISTFRALLSTLIIILYLPASEETSAWKRAGLTAAALLFALVHSFDRLLLGWVSIVAIAAYELATRWRNGDSRRVALHRLGRVAAAFAGGFAALGIVGRLFGFRIFDYLAGQAIVASGYRSMFGGWAPEVRSANTVALLAASLLIAVAIFAVRSSDWRFGAWICGAVPLAAFAVGIPDRGHIYVGVLPLVLVLLSIPFHSVQRQWLRWSSAIPAGMFALGWFGAFPEDLWVSPKTLAPAIEIARGRTRDADFTTDFGNAVRWVRSSAREPAGCIVTSPGMAVVHALAEVPGPTFLRPRWSLAGHAALAADIRQARCAHYIHQLQSFDDVRGAEWRLGADWLALSELYGQPSQISAATFALSLRDEPAPATRVALSSNTLDEDIVPPKEIRIPLGRELDNHELVEIEYRLSAGGFGPMLGRLPEIDYYFEGAGVALSELRPFFHLEPNREARAVLAVDAEAAEWRWLLEKRLHRKQRADALVLRFSSPALLAPKTFKFVIRSIAALSPSAPLGSRATACQPELDVARLVTEGAAFTRSVSPRATSTKIRMQTNPPGWHVAELFVPVTPCEDSCLYAELGLDPPSGGDGVTAEIHLLDRELRPLLFTRHLPPGAGPVSVELPLWHWKESDVLLRFGSLPGESDERDFAFIAKPRIRTCSSRVQLASAVRDGRALTAGSVRARGEDLELGTAPARVSYPLRVTLDTCLHQAFEVTGQAEGSWLFEAHVRVDGIDHRLFHQRVEASSGVQQNGPISLHDWDGRDVELVLGGRPHSGGAAAIRSPRLSSCATRP